MDTRQGHRISRSRIGHHINRIAHHTALGIRNGHPIGTRHHRNALGRSPRAPQNRLGTRTPCVVGRKLEQIRRAFCGHRNDRIEHHRLAAQRREALHITIGRAIGRYRISAEIVGRIRIQTAHIAVKRPIRSTRHQHRVVHGRHRVRAEHKTPLDQTAPATRSHIPIQTRALGTHQGRVERSSHRIQARTNAENAQRTAQLVRHHDIGQPIGALRSRNHIHAFGPIVARIGIHIAGIQIVLKLRRSRIVQIVGHQAPRALEAHKGIRLAIDR